MKLLLILSLFFLFGCDFILEKGSVQVDINNAKISILTNGVYINGFELMKKPMKYDQIHKFKKEKNNRYSGEFKSDLLITNNISHEKFIGYRNVKLNFSNDVLTICSPDPSMKNNKIIKKHKLNFNYTINIQDNNLHKKKQIKVNLLKNDQECYSTNIPQTKEVPIKKPFTLYTKGILLLILYLFAILGVYLWLD